MTQSQMTMEQLHEYVRAQEKDVSGDNVFYGGMNCCDADDVSSFRFYFRFNPHLRVCAHISLRRT